MKTLPINYARGEHPPIDDAVSRKSESTGSAHIVYALKWFLGGHAVDVKPVKAFTTRKKANAFAKEKNKKATQCEYVAKSLKLHE